MDDDDEPIKSFQLLVDESIEDLASSCKPVNINLNRIDLSKSSILVKYSDTPVSKDIVSSHISESGETVLNNEKDDQEHSSNDTAETIKKIKEFIALGRCEDQKKDTEASENAKRYRPGPLSKKKGLAISENQKVKKAVSINTAKRKVNMGLELEQTLKGLDSDDLPHSSADDGKEASLRKECNSENKATDVTQKNNELMTPSRVSKRIQSKSVKFSVKKMLRGDDVNVLKRMIPGYDDDTPVKKERTVQKAVKHETKRTPAQKAPSPPREQVNESNDSAVVSESSPAKDTVKSPSPTPEPIPPTTEVLNSSSPSSPVSQPVPEPQTAPASQTTTGPQTAPASQTTTGPQTSPASQAPPTSPTASSPQTVQVPQSTPAPQTTTPALQTAPAPVAQENKISSLAEKLGKLPIANGKITLELKGLQQKKVVRIAVPPPKLSSPLPKTSLGPDIIIKRIKPVKKTIVIPENVKPSRKTLIEKEIEDFRPVSGPPKKIMAMPHINIERIPPKLKEGHGVVSKVVRRGRPPKSERILRFADEESLPTKESSQDSQGESLNKESPDPQSDSIKERINDNKIDDTPQDPPSLTQQITEAIESTVSLIDENPSPKEEANKKKISDKIKGRKIPKLSPVSQFKSKVESQMKKIKSQKSDEKSPFNSDIEEPEEENINTLFDKYFKTEERYIEHHDSLDSDSSDDYESEIFSHFINLRRPKELKPETGKREDATLNNIMQDISTELPSWNIHVSSNGENFYLAQVDAHDDRPSMRKVIEIDLHYNAKVYYNGRLVPEYGGNYSSYEDIKQLIYDVDQL